MRTCHGQRAALASPWGIALAPMSFGKFGGDLLVGNFAFGDSVINAFDPTTWALEGSIDVNPGAGNTPGGLWSMAFGGGGNDGNPNTLFFTDGINGETDGLFGSIAAVPEPSTWAMMLAGFGGLALLAARRRRARRRSADQGSAEGQRNHRAVSRLVPFRCVARDRSETPDRRS